ncbi:MAG: UDP-N-acetylmuramate dehydrogenase [Eubacterium sp.]|nr:UDP-N-acetylmuramate dehydrogenase [Eubacterium sp.]MCM1213871.1 UDP-N-acetylmuramate dehydrogenase [Lachnospiraceae bacterium]MCM1303260.1 UDP-N-acetylmuramate dehydrogenase [Butyrivibrio sp.]MCM1343153.1 UDP-N-acetylmuramate dehydrogenase [Muribaculaceae bacterium]MCM1240132.1 UDP-N-acetylmuramate dehydrogenase [Lachnospiraceae bacterium]
MISAAVVEALKGYVPEENIRLQEKMAGHTTFRIGGPADCFLQLENEEQLRKVQRYLNLIEESYFILGNGSNLLVSDSGYRGIILQIGQKMNRIRVNGHTIVAQAGAPLSQVSKAAYENSLTGLEFAAGIPGTVGGGVVMNAGAYGGEMSQVVTLVRVIDKNGEVMELDNSTMEFGYRYSAIKKYPFTVTEVTLKLAEGNKDEIRARIKDLYLKRKEKQPLEYPSAGSTFKRPEGYFAGKLIMDAGMRGFQIGGARVSDKHCGFIINTGNATAEDVKDVIKEVQAQVKERFHVDLEPEIVFL